MSTRKTGGDKPPLTPQEIIDTATRGTTMFRRGRVELLYADQSFALLKWPGERTGRAGFASWTSSWVTRAEMADLLAACRAGQALAFSAKADVWDCGRDADGPLTAKRLQALIERQRGVRAPLKN